jgi:hypothetical protein
MAAAVLAVTVVHLLVARVVPLEQRQQTLVVLVTLAGLVGLTLRTVISRVHMQLVMQLQRVDPGRMALQELVVELQLVHLLEAQELPDKLD